MRVTVIASVLIALCSTSFVLAQDKKPSAQQQGDDKPAPGKTYVPGIEQFMGVIQREHIKLWYAARANNWELADFQLGEIKELMGDIQDLYPKFKSLPFADMLDAVIVGQIADLEKIVAAKDAKGFPAAFDKLTEACNSCHQAVGIPFIAIQRPTGNPFTNQRFEPKK